MTEDVHTYVRSCHERQLFSPLPPYRTTVSLPLTDLFGTFSIDFAGPLPESPTGNKYILVEHLTGWPIAKATPRATADVVQDFVESEIIYSFRAPHRRFLPFTRAHPKVGVAQAARSRM